MSDIYDDVQRANRARRKRAKAKTLTIAIRPIDAEGMQSAGEALFGVCKFGCGLLEVDGSCAMASSHPKHECRDCGAAHEAPISIAHPCLFCGSDKAA